MPDITDINDIIAAYHAGEIYCGPEVVALVAEIERLRSVEARLGGLLVEASMHLAPEWGNPHDVDVMNRVDAAANDYEPHPTEPGLYRRKETK